MQFDAGDYDPWGTRRTSRDLGMAPEPTSLPPTPAPPVTGQAADGDVEPFSYQSPAYTGPSAPQYNLPNAPVFHGPSFEAPDLQGVLADPSYQFRLNQGLGALQNAAAAKGVLRTGGALKGLNDYAQNSASQEYSNIYNRALQKYGADYQLSKDEFAPQFADYNNRFGAATESGNLSFQQQYNLYIAQLQDELAREQMLSGMQLPT